MIFVNFLCCYSWTNGYCVGFIRRNQLLHRNPCQVFQARNLVLIVHLHHSLLISMMMSLTRCRRLMTASLTCLEPTHSNQGNMKRKSTWPLWAQGVLIGRLLLGSTRCLNSFKHSLVWVTRTVMFMMCMFLQCPNYATWIHPRRGWKTWLKRRFKVELELGWIVLVTQCFSNKTRAWGHRASLTHLTRMG